MAEGGLDTLTVYRPAGRWSRVASSLKRGRNVIVVAFCDGGCFFLSSLTASSLSGDWIRWESISREGTSWLRTTLGSPTRRGDDVWAGWQERAEEGRR